MIMRKSTYFVCRVVRLGVLFAAGAACSLVLDGLVAGRTIFIEVAGPFEDDGGSFETVDAEAAEGVGSR
jgi:hypothetical protein